MKLVGGDSGRYERETWVDEVLLAPSERAVMDVLFDAQGRWGSSIARRITSTTLERSLSRGPQRDSEEIVRGSPRRSGACR